MNPYQLLDSGHGQKLERFGRYTLIRPAAQAVWDPQKLKAVWKKADLSFRREGAFRWSRSLSSPWEVCIRGVRFLLRPTDFGHLGVFPEHQLIWKKAARRIQKGKTSVLNLFAYSGGATLACAQAGASVCHVDASKGMVQWAKENAKLNGLESMPIRWIVDDVNAFLRREVKRKRVYDAMIVDPPSYGRGAKGEVFKFERDITKLLQQCRSVLSPRPEFFFLSCHTAQITPQILKNLLAATFPKGHIESGELCLQGEEGVFPLPSGAFAEWIA